MSFSSLADAAQVLCCSKQHLYDLAKRGEIDLVKVTGRTLVTQASIDRAIAEAKPFEHGARGPRRPRRATTSSTL